MKFQKCPICEGKGIVPGGFYNALPGCPSTSDALSEPCRACQGQGIIYIEEPGDKDIQSPFNQLPPGQSGDLAALHEKLIQIATVKKLVEDFKEEFTSKNQHCVIAYDEVLKFLMNQIEPLV